MSKVLIIEDDLNLQRTTCEFLQEEGYTVISASNGIEGIQYAVEELPDIILCDIAMPKLNGYEVFKFLSENSSTSSIPFVFLTAKTEKEDVRTGMQLGADDYITKPFDFDELITAIKVRIEKHNKIILNYEDQFRSILNYSLSGVFIFQDDKFTFGNAKFLKIIGYSVDELNELSYDSFIHEDDVEEIVDKTRKCLKGIQNSFGGKIRVISKEKNEKLVEISCNITKINNVPAILGNILEDEENFDTNLKTGNVEELNNVIQYLSDNRNKISDDLLHRIFEAKEPIIEEPINTDKLSKREVEILDLICSGLTNQEISEQLFISHRTVDTHRSNLLSKTGSKNTAELIVYAIKNNFYTVD
jgi:PAS domain S-box-containing protein